MPIVDCFTGLAVSVRKFPPQVTTEAVRQLEGQTCGDVFSCVWAVELWLLGVAGSRVVVH